VYSDWYLPSKDELNKLYLNKTAVGGFADDDYWSSSEYYADHEWSSRAWYQFFGEFYQNSTYKDALNRVRAVRAF
jgi:hypothetical protein